MVKVGLIFILGSALFVSICRGDVRDALRRRPLSRSAARFERQQQLSPTPYPASGFQPERQFPLPASNDDELAQPQVAPNTADTSIEQVASRPDAIYGAPARFRQSLEARPQVPQQFQQQQTYAAPPQQLIYGAPEVAVAEPARLRAAQPARLNVAQPARLSADPEEREDDIDNGAEEVEVSPKDAQPKAVAPPAQATVTYFPAGAVSFVQPNAFKLPTEYQAAMVGVPAQYQPPTVGVPAQLQTATVPVQVPSALPAVPARLQSAAVAVPAPVQTAAPTPVIASPSPAALVASPAPLSAQVLASPATAQVVASPATAPVVSSPAAYTQPQVYVQPQAYSQPQLYAPQAYAAPAASSAFYQPQFAAYTAATTPYSAYTAVPAAYSAYTAAPAQYAAAW